MLFSITRGTTMHGLQNNLYSSKCYVRRDIWTKGVNWHCCRQTEMYDLLSIPLTLPKSVAKVPNIKVRENRIISNMILFIKTLIDLIACVVWVNQEAHSEMELMSVRGFLEEERG